MNTKPLFKDEFDGLVKRRTDAMREMHRTCLAYEEMVKGLQERLADAEGQLAAAEKHNEIVMQGNQESAKIIANQSKKIEELESRLRQIDPDHYNLRYGNPSQKVAEPTPSIKDFVGIGDVRVITGFGMPGCVEEEDFLVIGLGDEHAAYLVGRYIPRYNQFDVRKDSKIITSPLSRFMKNTFRTGFRISPKEWSQKIRYVD